MFNKLYENGNNSISFNELYGLVKEYYKEQKISQDYDTENQCLSTL